MNTLRKKIGLAVVVAMAFAVPVVLSAQNAPAPGPAPAPTGAFGSMMSLLPADSNMAIAISFAGFANQKSLLSYVPRADMKTALAAELASQGSSLATTSSAAELAMRFAFASDLSELFTGVVFGLRLSPDSSDLHDGVVLVGNFKGAEVGAKLLELGATASGTGATVTGDGGKKYHMASPRDGVLLIGEDSAWVNAGGGNGLASNKSFQTSVSALGTRVPDAVVWLDVALARQAAQEPMVAMMVAPLLNSNGFLLSLDPGDVPSLGLTASYNDAQAAQVGNQFFNQLILMGKAQVETMSQGNAEAAASSMKLLSEVRVENDDRSATMRVPLSNLPSRDEVRQQFLESMQQALSGNLDLPAGMMAPEPAAPEVQ